MCVTHTRTQTVQVFVLYYISTVFCNNYKIFGNPKSQLYSIHGCIHKISKLLCVLVNVLSNALILKWYANSFVNTSQKLKFKFPVHYIH